MPPSGPPRTPDSRPPSRNLDSTNTRRPRGMLPGTRPPDMPSDTRHRTTAHSPPTRLTLRLQGPLLRPRAKSRYTPDKRRCVRSVRYGRCVRSVRYSGRIRHRRCVVRRRVSDRRGVCRRRRVRYRCVCCRRRDRTPDPTNARLPNRLVVTPRRAVRGLNRSDRRRVRDDARSESDIDLSAGGTRARQRRCGVGHPKDQSCKLFFSHRNFPHPYIAPKRLRRSRSSISFRLKASVDSTGRSEGRQGDGLAVSFSHRLSQQRIAARCRIAV